MNCTQTRRIEQITEKTLIVGVDIAKKTHVARAQDFRGIELAKRFVFANNRNGLNGLVGWIRTLMSEHGKTKVLFGMEPTGHYWLPLAHFLRKQGIRVVLVNPMHVKKSKELDDNSPTKNDVKDARVIAQLVKDGRYSEPGLPTGVYADLRTAMVQRDRLNQDLNRIKGRIHNWLDRYFPEYLEVFKSWEGKASLLTLKHFPLPRDVVEWGVDRMVTLWKTEVKRAVGEKRAQALVEAATESIGLTEGLDMARMELSMHLESYEALCHQMERLSQYIQKLLEHIPEAAPMMTIPGVGWVTVAGFLSEVGDLSGYEHPQQIVKLAGLNLKEHRSGKHKGQTRITKRGRPRLRSLLYKCALVLVAKNPEFRAIHRYLTTRLENPLKKKQSLMALCSKLVRVFFVIGRRKTSYDGGKLLKDTQTLQEAA